MRRFTVKVIKKNRSVKFNAFLNVIKELMSIIFPMITFPYATRVLGLDNYGKYTFSASIVN
jgi:O-antigen/teichoic acid export membrane protein